MNKTHISWSDITLACEEIANQVRESGFVPDYIVGITRGGCIPAVILSHMLDVRCEMVKIKLRDAAGGEECESNCWMAEDAFGYQSEESDNNTVRQNQINTANILVVDDINDTGATFNWLVSDWTSNAGWLAKEHNPWHNNVKFATLFNNVPSSFKDVDYYSVSIDKNKDPSWIVFPWEE
jgi:hypoxanthine phosphoribosyltransferase